MGQSLRLLPKLSFGTDRYPEKVAQRLRAVNFVSWTAALITFCWAIPYIFASNGDQLRLAFMNAVAAATFAALPLLHFVGPLAGPSAVILASYAYCFLVVWMLGTNAGIQFYFVAGAALTVFFFGVHRIAMSLALGAVAASLIVAVELFAPRDTGIDSVTMNMAGLVTNAFLACGVVILVVYYALREMARAEEAADREHQRSESLLANILPTAVAARLKGDAEAVIADRYEDAAILFADMEGYTSRASVTSPDHLVQLLNRVFTEFDGLVERHGLEKIKTTGDAYVVVSGLPERRPDPAAVLASLALDMRDASENLRDADGRKVPIRIGLSCGPVVAGVVGRRKFFYDVWGDAVNVASRMETTGEEGKIQVSRDAYELLKDDFALQERGWVDVKGKGTMQTWFLIARRQASGL